ncbi:MAG: methionine--tRNA ligase [Clostridium sp.]|uniref:methionine--tRNA ligase n=1 Tax=Clostridium sp. TaxID=1506 RepID=UPI003F348EBF
MNIIVGNAWPYANGKLHLGRIATLLPGDILARYHRMMGDNVLFISGSDAHGRPVTMKAIEENTTPKKVLDKYHKEFVECFNKLNFSFDLFTSTHTDYHKKEVMRLIKELYKKDYIYEGTDKELYFSLSKFENDVKKIFVKQQGWRENALNITKKYIDEGLRDKSVTKEIDWGVDVPLEGFEDKKIFVWIEALMGYVTATNSCLINKDETIEDFFNDEEGKVYLVHGKDNIPFHTIIFPGLLSALGFDKVNLSIMSSEHLKLEGKDFSTNKNWAIWVDDICKRYDVDTIRYYLILNGPEDKDTDFKWKNFINANNYDLVSELDLLYRNTVLNLRQESINEGEKDKLLNMYFDISDKIEEGNFKDALKEIFALIKEENKKKKCSVITLINIANMLEPFMPKTAKRIKEEFGVNKSIWSFITIERFPKKVFYRPLFRMIDRKNLNDEIRLLKDKKI